MDYEVVFQAGVTALSIAVAAGWFFWQRYQALEKRLRHMEGMLTALEHKQELSRQAIQGNEDNLQYLVNANSQLIEHRTRRFCDQLEALESRLGTDIKEVKNWLDGHTEFKIRER